MKDLGKRGESWLESRVERMSHDGSPGVLIQLPHGWIVIPPEDARKVAALLMNVADEADEIAKEEGSE